MQVNSLLLSTLVWLCPVPDQQSLSCLLIKFLSDSFLGEGFQFCVHVCISGFECSNWGQTTGRRSYVSMVLATGVSVSVQVCNG